MTPGLKEIGCLGAFTYGWKPSEKFLEIIRKFEADVLHLANTEGLTLVSAKGSMISRWDWDEKIGGWQRVIN